MASRLVASALAALAALALAGATAAAAGAGPRSGVPLPTALPDCLGHPKAQPTAIVLACADANFGVRRLRWTGWGEPFAAAIGTAYANDCTPNCAAGKFHDYRAVVVASGSQRCPGGVIAYREVTVAFVGPSPYPRNRASDFVYPFRCGSR